MGGLLPLTLESQVCSHPCQPFCSAVAPVLPMRLPFLVLLPPPPPQLHQGFASASEQGWGEVLWAAVLGSLQSPGWQLVNSAT